MKLRKITGYNYVNCKKALDKFGPDNIEEATVWLRELAKKEGWTKAAKLSDRRTTEGLLSVATNENVAAVVELDCQTDFVARGDDFKNLITNVTVAILNHAKAFSSSVNVAKGEIITVPVQGDEIKMSDGTSVKEAIAMTIGKLGENITSPTMSMIFTESDVKISGHSHPKEKLNQCEIGRFVSLACLKRDPIKSTSFPSEILGEQICQHIIGMKPETIGKPPEVVNKTKDDEIKKTQEDDQTKETQEEEDVNAYYSGRTTELNEDETGLLRQQFMLNPSQSVYSYLEGHGAQIVNYLRMEVGEKSVDE